MDPGIPDMNLFMMCEKLCVTACTPMPSGYHVRVCRPDELDLWKDIHYDDEETALTERPYMNYYFDQVFKKKEDLFFQSCLFICDRTDTPVGTCFAWKAYDVFTTIQWFKVRRSHEGCGIGRALLSLVMMALDEGSYPVLLHTQPASYRAIKLYSDFGFALLSNADMGLRSNDLAAALPILEHLMRPEDFKQLQFSVAPPYCIDAITSSKMHQF